ncbi:hypothetical protein FIBSPDRAFT_895932 [Athelia psychrophila]|uniref:Uncharacterized protein n=1 Tax=Athelia psychrophila TaxID=1759441 RepID=A0A166E371_9AGAM|nr:hypothetical protein FIBSPDRAFT_895932 [Fibularhizoctonia sp. CBS 109695]
MRSENTPSLCGIEERLEIIDVGTVGGAQKLPRFEDTTKSAETLRNERDDLIARLKSLKSENELRIAVQDSLGLGAEEARANRERGVDVSLADAQMDGTGKVVIAGPPPDEESRA